jgi:hypothetical protein
MKSLGNRIKWIGVHPNMSDKALMNCRDQIKVQMGGDGLEKRRTVKPKISTACSFLPL